MSVELKRMPVMHRLFGAFNLAFKSQPMTSVMDLHLLPFLLGLVRNRTMTCKHFIGYLLLSATCASAAVRLVDGRTFFFFFFFTVDHTTNQVQTPSLPYESSFVCPRCANFLDDP